MRLATMDTERRIVRFEGDVQGVGFRYTACRLAGGFEVTGYVRNMPDGSVECLAEGGKADLDAFIGELTRQMGRYIRRVTQQSAPYEGTHKSFTVRF